MLFGWALSAFRNSLRSGMAFPTPFVELPKIPINDVHALLNDICDWVALGRSFEPRCRPFTTVFFCDFVRFLPLTCFISALLAAAETKEN